MIGLKELLLTFEHWLLQKQAIILNRLQKGTEENKAQELLIKSNIVSDKLLILYNWKNGVSDDLMTMPIEEIELFPEGIMLSLQEALSRYSLYVEVERIWGEKLFPIFTNGGGDYLLLDTNQESTQYGMILQYAPALLLTEEPESIYDSLETMFETILSCVKEGAYRYSLNDAIDVDYDLKYKISANYNPKSKYWDDYRKT